MNDSTYRKLEDRAVPLLLAFSGLMFAAGIAIQRTGKAIESAATWASPR